MNKMAWRRQTISSLFIFDDEHARIWWRKQHASGRKQPLARTITRAADICHAGRLHRDFHRCVNAFSLAATSVTSAGEGTAR